MSYSPASDGIQFGQRAVWPMSINWPIYRTCLGSSKDVKRVSPDTLEKAVWELLVQFDKYNCHAFSVYGFYWARLGMNIKKMMCLIGVYSC